MAFCQNCGTKLQEGVRFCPSCGTPVGTTKPTKTFVGEIRKCPNCGETLGAMDVVCPTCKHEIIGRRAVQSVSDFFERYQQELNEQKKLELVSNFPIPNTKEDLLEFAYLTAQQMKTLSSSITAEYDLGIQRSKNDSTILPADFFIAWSEKAEQINSKAELLFAKDETTLQTIRKILSDAAKKSSKVKIKLTKQKRKSNIVFYLFFLFAFSFFGVLYFFAATYEKKAQEAYSEIIMNIENGDYVAAELLLPKLDHVSSEWTARQKELKLLIDEKKRINPENKDFNTSNIDTPESVTDILRDTMNETWQNLKDSLSL